MYNTLTPALGHWAISEKNKTGGGGGGWRWNFQGLIKNNVEFPGVIKKEKTKNHMEFPGVLVLGLKGSDGCNTILWSFLG